MRKDNTDIEKQFIALYDSLSDAIFRHCAFRLSNRERALELMQETFTKAWDYLQAGTDIENPKALIYRIANNLIIDEYRKKKSVSLDDLQETGFDVANTDEAGIVQAVEIGHIHKAIATIPAKYRQVVVMRFVDGLSPKEIGTLTKQSENAVSVQLNRAVKMLKDILKI